MKYIAEYKIFESFDLLAKYECDANQYNSKFYLDGRSKLIEYSNNDLKMILDTCYLSKIKLMYYDTLEEQWRELESSDSNCYLLRALVGIPGALYFDFNKNEDDYFLIECVGKLNKMYCCDQMDELIDFIKILGSIKY